MNNGITIVVQEKDALDLSKNSSVTLKYEKPEMISIINGAQTISTAAEFWYENSSDGEQEDKDAREARKEVKERTKDRAKISPTPAGLSWRSTVCLGRSKRMISTSVSSRGERGYSGNISTV